MSRAIDAWSPGSTFSDPQNPVRPRTLDQRAAGREHDRQDQARRGPAQLRGTAGRPPGCPRRRGEDDDGPSYGDTGPGHGEFGHGDGAEREELRRRERQRQGRRRNRQERRQDHRQGRPRRRATAGRRIRRELRRHGRLRQQGHRPQVGPPLHARGRPPLRRDRVGAPDRGHRQRDRQDRLRAEGRRGPQGLEPARDQRRRQQVLPRPRRHPGAGEQRQAAHQPGRQHDRGVGRDPALLRHATRT